MRFFYCAFFSFSSFLWLLSFFFLRFCQQKCCRCRAPHAALWPSCRSWAQRTERERSKLSKHREVRTLRRRSPSGWQRREQLGSRSAEEIMTHFDESNIFHQLLSLGEQIQKLTLFICIHHTLSRFCKYFFVLNCLCLAWSAYTCTCTSSYYTIPCIVLYTYLPKRIFEEKQNTIIYNSSKNMSKHFSIR